MSGAKNAAVLALLLVLPAHTADARSAQQGPSIRAEPAESVGVGRGSTTIRWRAPEGASGEVYVSINGGPEILFGGISPSGSQDAAWIEAGSTYDFRLYEGAAHRNLLAHVLVTRRLPAESVPPSKLSFFSVLALPSALLVWLAIRRRPLAWLGLATVLFVGLNHELVRGTAVALWDADSAFYQYQVLVADHARAGRFVSWDPWSNGGMPASGDPQVGAYSPVTTMIGLIFGGTQAGFIAYWLLVWWLGGFGMFMLGRWLGAPPWGRFVVTLGFLFCGVYTGQAQHTPFVAAFSALPLVIWRLDVALTTRSWLAAAQAGAIWGGSALSGDPSLVIINLGFAALWTAGHWLCRRPETTFKVAVLSFAVMLGVGVVVLSPTYVGFFVDGAGTHTRVGQLSREVAAGAGALHPGALITFASPHLAILKLYHLQDLWPYTDVSMVSIFTGAAIPVLACVAVASARSDRWRWWLAALAVLSLGCALAQTLPLRGWLYDLVIPTRYFRHAAIFRDYYVFAIGVLALIGTRDLADGSVRTWRVMWICAVVLAAAAIITFAVAVAGISGPPGRLPLAMAHLTFAWGTLAVAAYLLRRDPGRWLPAFGLVLSLVAVVDAAGSAKLSQETTMNSGGHPLAPPLDRWQALAREHNATLDLPEGLQRAAAACYGGESCPFVTNDQMVNKKPVFRSSSPQINLFHQQISLEPVLLRMAVGRERVWFTRTASTLAPTMQNFATFLEHARASGVSPLLVHTPESMLRIGHEASGVEDARHVLSLPPVEKIHPNVLRYSAAEVRLEVEAPAAGWLLLTDRWGSGWRAEVNGRPVAVHGANFIFRAVEVGPGRNVVRFWYRSASYPWLLLLSWSTLAALIAVTVGLSIRSRRVQTV